ncbi:MAG TPA: VOC family protein [Ferruginibacter sp.]|nr:VOC family protein [Ferruginibacter sp.]
MFQIRKSPKQSKAALCVKGCYEDEKNNCYRFGRKEKIKINTIYAYLSFNGNCGEAMQFYQKCLGGILSFQTVGDAPNSKKMPDNIKKFILHSTLKSKNFILMGSDMVDEQELIKGNAVSLMQNCAIKKEIREQYKMLSQGGVKTHPLIKTFNGVLFCMLKDKFGHNWLLHFKKA